MTKTGPTVTKAQALADAEALKSLLDRSDGTPDGDEQAVGDWLKATPMPRALVAVTEVMRMLGVESSKRIGQTNAWRTWMLTNEAAFMNLLGGAVPPEPVPEANGRPVAEATMLPAPPVISSALLQRTSGTWEWWPLDEEAALPAGPPVGWVLAATDPTGGDAEVVAHVFTNPIDGMLIQEAPNLYDDLGLVLGVAEAVNAAVRDFANAVVDNRDPTAEGDRLHRLHPTWANVLKEVRGRMTARHDALLALRTPDDPESAE